MTVNIQAARAHLRAREQQLMMEREQRRQHAARAAREAARVVMPMFHQVRKAYLFGSVIHTGAMRRDSDIDVAVEGHLDTESDLARRAAQLLESIYPADDSRFITFLDKLTQEEQQP